MFQKVFLTLALLVSSIGSAQMILPQAVCPSPEVVRAYTGTEREQQVWQHAISWCSCESYNAILWEFPQNTIPQQYVEVLHQKCSSRQVITRNDLPIVGDVALSGVITYQLGLGPNGQLIRAKANDEELVAAQAWAERGQNVKFHLTASRQGIHGQKTADMFVESVGLVEVKSIASTNLKSVANAISTKIRGGQATKYHFRLSKGFPLHNLEALVNRTFSNQRLSHLEEIIFEIDDLLIRFFR